MDTFLRIFEKILIVYFLAYFLIDFYLFVHSLLIFGKLRKAKKEKKKFKKGRVSIVVPAFNEEVSIASSVEMLMRLEYPDYEIIVVNDGSKDNTLQILSNAFPQLKSIHCKPSGSIPTKAVREIFGSEDGKLLVVDKENGGKADSINAAVNCASGEYVCTIDADSILDKGALTLVVEPLATDKKIVVSGGQLAIANDITIEGNTVISAKMPKNSWVLWQIVEYIKSFMISRLGLSAVHGLLIMSGAFSMYRLKDLIAVGGFLTAHNNSSYIIERMGEGKKTVCEDMEIVIRLRRYYYEQGKKGRTAFLPQPVCWTEVPDSGSNLLKQRSRWQMGLAESISFHKALIFEPKFGRIGLIAMPYYFFFELLAPIIKLVTLFFLIIVSVQGLINISWVLMLLIAISLTTAVVMSTITVAIEKWSVQAEKVNRDTMRYKTFGDWMKLLLFGILGDFSYALFRTYAQLVGLIKFLGRSDDWNKFERKGFNHK
jgi:cellulose synthase/poly-beta-1,6-N-acetylglucosamine synthase-like glycosyltransferase